MLSIGLGYDPGYLTRQVGKGAENYYLSSIGDDERGEPPGVWSGRACAELGFTAGDPVDAEAFERLYRSFADPRHPAFNDPSVPEADKPTLGSRPARFTEETGRKPVYFLDLTFSPPKSVTLLHAGLLAKAAEQQHHHPEAALALRAQAQLVWEAVMAGNAAMLEFYQDVCGVSRAGKHGPKVAAAPPAAGWMRPAGWSPPSGSTPPATATRNCMCTTRSSTASPATSTASGARWTAAPSTPPVRPPPRWPSG